MAADEALRDRMEEARQLLGQVLGRSPDGLADAALGNPPSWDSLAHMRLVLALEARLGRRLEAREILSIDRLAAIAQLLER